MGQTQYEITKRLEHKSPYLNSKGALETSMEAQYAIGPDEVIELINEQEKRNFTYGVIFIILAVSSWIVGLELVNGVMKGGKYNKPFFVAYVTTSTFTILLIPEIFYSIRALFKQPYEGKLNESSNLLGNEFSSTEEVEGSTGGNENINGTIELSRLEVLTLAMNIAIIYYSYTVVVLFALRYTSASNQTLVGSSTSMFTLIIGRFLNIDRFSIKKILCIIVSMTGIFLINISQRGESIPDEDDHITPKDPLLGNCLAMIGAFIYAIYLIILKVKCGTGDKSTNERRLLGFVGMFSLILGFPVVCFVNYLGIEEFELPPKGDFILCIILVNAFFSVMSDYFTILAMLLTSPLVTSLSLNSSIPITIIIDYVSEHIKGNNQTIGKDPFTYVVGIISMAFSVVLINVNISSENELIEELIEEAIGDAIKDDEVLSPVLSPLLAPGSSPSYRSPAFQTSRYVNIGFSTPILRRVYPNSKDSAIIKKVPDLDLNGTQEDNMGFVEIPERNEEFNQQQSKTNGTQEDGNLVVFGGKNHKYRVRLLQASDHGRDVV